MSISELCTKGAGELTAMIRAHAVTSREIVDAHLDRIATSIQHPGLPGVDRPVRDAMSDDGMR